MKDNLWGYQGGSDKITRSKRFWNCHNRVTQSSCKWRTTWSNIVASLDLSDVLCKIPTRMVSQIIKTHYILRQHNQKQCKKEKRSWGKKNLIFTHQTKACQLYKARAVKKSETIMWMATLTPIWLLNPNLIHSLFHTGIQGWFGFNWFAVESKDDQLLKVETTTKPANVNIITKQNEIFSI